jgi:hypothetical protein
MTSYVNRGESYVHNTARIAIENLKAWKEKEDQKIISEARARLVEARSKAWFKFLQSKDISDKAVKDWLHEIWDDFDLHRVRLLHNQVHDRLQTLVEATDAKLFTTMRLSVEDSVLLEAWGVKYGS